ncbi:MAG TPA: hypothetical protein VFO29_11995 [Candidatus Rubrimentiphilum sp.]|nr:hypothetical protein [Candidatus Rubrimentiphilum sp.]
MDTEEAKRLTIEGIAEWLAEEFQGATVTKPTHLAPRALFNVIRLGQEFRLSITPTALAVITVNGAYLDKEHARMYIAQQDRIVERMLAGEDVVIYA